VDRRLLTIACVALALEFLLFLGNTGVIPYSLWKSARPTVEQPKLGEIQTARRNVRRKGFDSSIWEDSSSKDNVFENDSILTLSDSSARLKLRGGVNLDLQENTLVVLEPLRDDPEKPFRVRFSRGDFRGQSGAKGLQVTNGEWVIKATTGTDLSVRAVDSQRVEVEVHNGDVHVSHGVHGQVRELGRDQRLILFPEEAGEIITTSREISWADPRPQRVYAHEFPVNVDLIWDGDPERVEILTPAKGTEKIKLPQQGRLHYSFSPGSHHLTLHKGKEISRALSIQVMHAPKIIHLTPLPRDRVKTAVPVLFAWLSEITASNFRLELASDKEFKNIVHVQSTKTARVETEIPVTGDLNWRVIAFDEDGFLIPAAYSYPVISHPDPLAPPMLRAPTATEGDDEARTPRILKWLEAGWRLFFPAANGQTTKKHPPPVIFNWDAVPGADYYVIEISRTADFSNPDIIAKVSTNTYAWGRFTKNVYYYRVAGGTNDGRVGYFSQPERVDLTNWPPPKAKPKRTTGADVVQATPLPPAPPAPPPAPPKPAPTAAKPASPATQPSAAVAVSNAPVETAPESRRATGRAWWGAALSTTQESAPETVKSSRSGVQPYRFGIEFEGFSARSGWRLSVDAHQFTWKAKDEVKWPYQPEQSGLAWNARAYYAREITGLAYGIGLGQNPVTSRKDIEEVEMSAEFAFGPSVAAHFKSGDTARAHTLTLTYSTSLISAVTQNYWRWYFGEKYFAGIQGDLAYGFGEDRSVTTFDLGAQVGVSW
jgi:hypothetical protein